MAPKSMIEDHKDQLIHTLEELGWVINYEKSVITPTTSITYIGFDVDTVTSQQCPTLWVTKARVVKLHGRIKRLLNKTHCSARNLARILGQCISMGLAVVYGKVMLRAVYRLLRTKNSWDTMLKIDSDTIVDLNWWLQKIVKRVCLAR